MAGFLPSQDLTVSPLAATTDGGTTWSTGVLLSGLPAVPDALASPAGGPAIALVHGAGGTVVASGGGLLSWHRLVTEHALAGQSSAAGCGVTKITAVGLGGFGSPGSRVGFEQPPGPPWSEQPVPVGVAPVSSCPTAASGCRSGPPFRPGREARSK